MSLVNTKVVHKKFGEGVIIAEDNIYLTIKFQVGEKKFMYPDCFAQGFLQIEDKDLYQKSLEDMDIKNQEKIKK